MKSPVDEECEMYFFAILYVYVAKDSSYNGAVRNFVYSSSGGGGEALVL